MHARLKDVLDTIVATQAAGQLPVCVFDLDSTLFSTRGRTLRVLAEMARETGDAELADAVAGIRETDQCYNPLEPLAERIELDESHRAQALSYWKDRFFTDAWCAGDDIIPGAPAFVRACHERGAFLYYLTGRHVDGMAAGTVASLVRHGFPLFDGRALLQLKPDFETPDADYKTVAAASIRALRGTVVATFENEPGNANLFAEWFPGGTHFLLDTVHSPTAPPPRDDLVRIEDFGP